VWLLSLKNVSNAFRTVGCFGYFDSVDGHPQLTEQVETPDACLWHDEICDVNRRLTACGIRQYCVASSQREPFERLAQDFTTDLIDENVAFIRGWLRA
jgi:hypothetical protein